MKKFDPKPAPRFFWQGVLIVLPVVALAAVGLFSLRQDKLLAESEAKERAQTIADDLHTRIRNDLAKVLTVITNNQADRVAFKISTRGELLFPPPIAPLVQQTLPLEKLSESQAALWQAANAAEFRDTDTEKAIQAYREFMASHPPEEFLSRAFFAVGILLQSKNSDEAKRCFAEIVRKYPTATSDAGVSLAGLAEIKLLEIAFSPTNKLTAEDHAALKVFRRELIEKPTPLTAHLLALTEQWERAHGGISEATQATRDLWTRHEFARRLYQSANKQFASQPLAASLPISKPASFWFNDEQSFQIISNQAPPALGQSASPDVSISHDSYFCIMSNTASSLWINCISERELRRIVENISRAGKNIPDYFGISAELNGKKFTNESFVRPWYPIQWMGRKGGGTRKKPADFSTVPILASSAGPKDETNELKVNVHLTSRAALFERQRARSLWFGLLIAISAVAALVGLVAARRAFYRQLRLNEMKSNFVSSVSHELRAPIASVRLLAEGLERGKISGPQKQKEYFKFIVQECRRLSSLIENVLDFSRIEQGRKEYEFEPTDVVKLVQETVKLMEPYAAERNVNLALKLDDSQLSTNNTQPSLDGQAIQQALVNLIDNAIKHSPNGATVTVGFVAAVCDRRTLTENQRRSQTAATVEIYVEDAGPGIPPHEHEKIFERFYRLGSELRRETQGIGIGLSIVKHIVDAHGGKTLVRSEVGKGSRFTIELLANEQRKDAKSQRSKDENG